jgi:hypothetical protein
MCCGHNDIDSTLEGVPYCRCFDVKVDVDIHKGGSTARERRNPGLRNSIVSTVSNKAEWIIALPQLV